MAHSSLDGRWPHVSHISSVHAVIVATLSLPLSVKSSSSSDVRVTAADIIGGKISYVCVNCETANELITFLALASGDYSCSCYEVD